MCAFSELYGPMNTGSQSAELAAGVTASHPCPMFAMQHCFPGDATESAAMVSSRDWNYEQPEFKPLLQQNYHMN